MQNQTKPKGKSAATLVVTADSHPQQKNSLILNSWEVGPKAKSKVKYVILIIKLKKIAHDVHQGSRKKFPEYM